jgi:N utilization substance protein B
LSGLPEINPEDEVEIEVIEHREPVTERSHARRLALQILYELDCTRHQPGQVLDMQLADEQLDRKIRRSARMFVLGVLEYREQLDRVIQHYASEWPLDQVAIVDRNILRIAVYEFVIRKMTPVGVAIDEAIALARLFGGDSSISFVNGVLGKIARDEAAVRDLLGGETTT